MEIKKDTHENTGKHDNPSSTDVDMAVSSY